MTRTVLLAAALLPMLAPDEPSKSALESDPAGWTDLIKDAGHELKGWTRVPIPPNGKLGDKQQWSIDSKTGHLVCTGDGGHEWLRWDEELGDAIFHIEWRFTPVEGKKGYNSGVYARNSADGVAWHQAQTGDASGGYLFGSSLADGKPAPVRPQDRTGGKSRVKPAGEWNTFEITCRGETMSLWVNGAEASVWTSCKLPKGHVGVEAEGYRIEFRNVKVKKL